MQCLACNVSCPTSFCGTCLIGDGELVKYLPHDLRSLDDSQKEIWTKLVEGLKPMAWDHYAMVLIPRLLQLQLDDLKRRDLSKKQRKLVHEIKHLFLRMQTTGELPRINGRWGYSTEIVRGAPPTEDAAAEGFVVTEGFATGLAISLMLIGLAAFAYDEKFIHPPRKGSVMPILYPVALVFVGLVAMYDFSVRVEDLAEFFAKAPGHVGFLLLIGGVSSDALGFGRSLLGKPLQMLNSLLTWPANRKPAPVKPPDPTKIEAKLLEALTDEGHSVGIPLRGKKCEIEFAYNFLKTTPGDVIAKLNAFLRDNNFHAGDGQPVHIQQLRFKDMNAPQIRFVMTVIFDHPSALITNALQIRDPGDPIHTMSSYYLPIVSSKRDKSPVRGAPKALPPPAQPAKGAGNVPKAPDPNAPNAPNPAPANAPPARGKSPKRPPPKKAK